LRIAERGHRGSVHGARSRDTEQRRAALAPHRPMCAAILPNAPENVEQAERKERQAESFFDLQALAVAAMAS